MSAVFTAAMPLDPEDRSDFLAAIAGILQAQPDLEDGALHRTIAQVQRGFVTGLRRHAGGYT